LIEDFMVVGGQKAEISADYLKSGILNSGAIFSTTAGKGGEVESPKKSVSLYSEKHSTFIFPLAPHLAESDASMR
jgi:hypothetical protein